MKYKYMLMMLVLLLSVGIVSAAMCVETLSDIYISCGDNNINCEFGVGEELKNISVVVTSNVTTIDKVKIKVFLCKNEACDGANRLDELSAIFTNQDGQAFINCPGVNCLDATSIKSSGNYYIKAFVDPDNINRIITQQINIKKKLILLLSCPLEDFINREISCTFKVRDSDTNNLVSGYTPDVFVSGDNEIALSSDKVTFNTQSVGGVDVTVKVSKEGFLDTEETATIEIKHPVNQQVLLVDNTNFFDFRGEGISVGTHELKLKIDKSGVPIQVNSIEAVMITPSGREDPLNFNKVGDEWKSNYNFVQSATTYTLKGEVFFEDPAEDSLKFEYAMVTIGEITEAYGGGLLYIALGIGGGFIVIVVVLIIIFRVVGRKKRK